ncbi:MAG: YncE family protein [Calditrichia bacterium]
MKPSNYLRSLVLLFLFMGVLIVPPSRSTLNSLASFSGSGPRPAEVQSQKPARQKGETTAALRKLGLQLVADVPLPGGIARFDYQTIDQIHRRLFISQMGANLMTVFDLDANKIVGTVGDIPRPTGILAVPALNKVYVSASAANKVYVVDEKSLKTIAMVPTGSFPDGIAWDPELKRVFVSCEFGEAVTVFDALNNNVITNIQVDGEVGNTHFDPVSKMIFSTVQTNGELVEIDPEKLSIVARYPLQGCQGPHGFYIIPKPHYAFITGEDNASYVVFDMASKSIIARGKVGAGPDVLAYDSGYHRLYVASESGVLSVFDIEDRAVKEIGSAFLAEHAHSVSVDRKTHRVFLPLRNKGGRAVLEILKPD